ncbi:MAG: dihydropyrimidinase [Aggregatilineaceae bacterium]
MTFDLVVQGGTLVTAAETVQADLGIQGRRIAALGHGLNGARVFDARGMWVIPGGVDPHVHLQMPAGSTMSSDNWQTGTVAAACGGTTTVIDFVEPAPGQSLLDAYHHRRAEADGQTVVDYGLHMTLTPSALDYLAEIPQVMAEGLSSFKTYTTYHGFKLTDGEYLQLMQTVAGVGGLVMTHCEDDAIINFLIENLGEQKKDPILHAQTRPPVAEAAAIQRVLALAEIAQVAVYIVHISTALGIQALAQAPLRTAQAFGETCPQYLYLTAAEYARSGFEGAKFVCSPPLRAADDQAALWRALSGGTLQAVGSDHCPFNYAGQKDLGRDDFRQIPGGLPGVEARLALLHPGPHNGYALSLNRWVEVCCTAPAKLFGLYPRKGTLLPGADADVVIFDPQRTITITYQALHEHVDYTPYEGITVSGWPHTVISRGMVLVEHGYFCGPSGHGQYLQRGGWL